MSAPLPLTCGHVTASASGFAEVAHGRRLQFVPHADILRVELRRGSSANRPVAELVTGAIIVAVATYGMASLNASPIALRYDIMLFALAAIGAYMIFDVLHRRYFLEITSARHPIRLPFGSRADLPQIREFCAEAHRRFGCEIRDCLLLSPA